MDMKETWEKIKELIKDEMKDAPFTSFILPLEIVSIDKTRKLVTLTAPNKITKDRIEGRWYNNQIRDSIRDILGPDYDFKLVLPEDIKPVKKVKKSEKDSKYKGDPINPKYTFDNFVQGKSNHLATASAIAVARDPYPVATNPFLTYNPLFIYGGVGLGKTHLISAVANEIMKNLPDLDVMYVTSETFVNDFITSMKDKTLTEFREKYRNVDVLIVDDIQFLAGKESSQEEFFHTFNAIYNGERQIILTSDKPPAELQQIEERLQNRFGWSMTADITPPELETRIAILNKKAEREGLVVTPGMAEGILYIAEHIESNVRDMEGALTRLISHSNLENIPISREYAHRVLKDIVQDNKLKVTPDKIKEAVAAQFDIEVYEMESDKRSNNIVYPRRIAMYLCRERLGLPFKKIGEEFGGKDHSTVITSCRNIETDLKVNMDLQEVIKEIEERLK